MALSVGQLPSGEVRRAMEAFRTLLPSFHLTRVERVLIA